MSWVLLSLVSAAFLGLYEIAKKSAVNGNAIPPVLLLNVLTAAIVYAPLLLISWSYPERFSVDDWKITSITALDHLRLFCKSALVGASWILSFYALKHLPISIATPIRATSPLWTIASAVLLLGERPNPSQWIGMSMILIAFFAFSRIGKHEGIHFHRDRWIWLMIAATILGSASAIYDKYLLQTANLKPAVVQAWFSIYLVPVMSPLAIRWYLSDRAKNPFQWRWSIPLIALFLLIADYTYFTALSDPHALISVISPIRRASVAVAFLFGVLWLREKHWQPKAIWIFVLLLGVCLISIQ